MAVIKSGATSDQLTVDPTSKAARITVYDSSGREVSAQSKATYAASGTFTPAATPTDLLNIIGSNTKTIRVISIKFTTTNTAAGSQQFFLIKRSAANTGGTAVAATMIPQDSNDASATATVQHYTANPTGLGTAVGTISTIRVASPVAVPGSFAGIVNDAGVELLHWQSNTHLDKPVVLRGNTQVLAVNFNGAALVSGQTHAYTVVWTEE